MPTITDPHALADAIESASSLILRWGHGEMRQLPAAEVAIIAAALREQTWLEDELMECMRIVAPGMGGAMPDDLTFAIMVTAIRRLMEADTEKYEALLARWQERQLPQNGGQT